MNYADACLNRINGLERRLMILDNIVVKNLPRPPCKYDAATQMKNMRRELRILYDTYMDLCQS